MARDEGRRRHRAAPRSRRSALPAAGGTPARRPAPSSARAAHAALGWASSRAAHRRQTARGGTASPASPWRATFALPSWRCEDFPGQAPGVLTVLDDEAPVDDDMLDAVGIAMRIFVGGTIRDAPGIEHDEVGTRARAHHAPVA